MSDIGINFPPLFLIALALVLALPVTTAIMAGLGIAWRRLHRRNPNRPLTALKWSAIVVCPVWLAGLVLGGLWLASEIKREIYGAQHYFNLHDAAEVDGIRLPAGTQVTLYEDGALDVAELSEGATVALLGSTWQGKLEFAMPAQAPNGKHGQITTGTLAAPSIIEGIPCQAGEEIHFFWDGALMSCSLSANATVAAQVSDQMQNFRCRAESPIELQGGICPGQLGKCVLAEPAQIGQITCADGIEINLWAGKLTSCTVAKPTRFGPLDLPADSRVTYQDGNPSEFVLPRSGDPVDAFELQLPPGTEAAFCSDAPALARLNVERSRYVTLGGVKLTGDIEFDCGKFRNGQLFEDAMVGGNQRRAGDLVTQADLFP